jgi:hypothetical protein
MVLAAFIAGLNIYIYQAEKVFTPLLVLLLVVVYRRDLFRLPKKYLVASLLVGLVMVIPFAYQAKTTPEIFLRAKGTSFAADPTPFLAQSAGRLLRNQQQGDYFGLILDNRRVAYGLTFLKGYFSHFDLNWLMIRGDEARHHAPGMGLLYLWELPFLLWGIYYLVWSKGSRKTKLVVLGWLLISPIPAAFSSGTPHAVRTIRMMPIPQILVALGLLAFWFWLKKQKKSFKIPIVAFSFLFFVFNFTYFLNQYFVQQNYWHSQFWQYGYQEAVEKVQVFEPKFQKVVVSNQPHLDQSYIFFLYYTRLDPGEYQRLGGTVSGGFAETHRGFGKYTFRPIDWSSEEKDSVLFMGRPTDFPPDAQVLETINFLDGQEAIRIVKGG